MAERCEHSFCIRVKDGPSDFLLGRNCLVLMADWSAEILGLFSCVCIDRRSPFLFSSVRLFLKPILVRFLTPYRVGNRRASGRCYSIDR